MADGTNIIGYHVNDEEKCEKFLKEDEYIIVCPDKLWLGRGMYFWDNDSNANYWAKDKKKKVTSDLIKVKSNIYIDDMLDLSDLESLHFLNELWLEYCRKEKCKTNVRLGMKLDRIFDYYEDLSENYNVLKCYGRYDRTPEAKFITCIGEYTGPIPTHEIKCILSVKEADCIKNRKKVEVIPNE